LNFLHCLHRRGADRCQCPLSSVVKVDSIAMSKNSLINYLKNNFLYRFIIHFMKLSYETSSQLKKAEGGLHPIPSQKKRCPTKTTENTTAVIKNDLTRSEGGSSEFLSPPLALRPPPTGLHVTRISSPYLTQVYGTSKETTHPKSSSRSKSLGYKT
jgi:hypothetical protein